MHNLSRLRRTVNSKQCLTVRQLADRQTFPAEVRFQSHDGLGGIYGRLRGHWSRLSYKRFGFPLPATNSPKADTFLSSVADTEDPLELASDTK
jgi:hypothetical protein